MKQNRMSRIGARKLADVPVETLHMLSTGQTESVNLMEWLAADMGKLAHQISGELSHHPISVEFTRAAPELTVASITKRLAIAGRIIAEHLPVDSPTFNRLAAHRSDLVRQWSCYAVNDASIARPMTERLALTSRFAADPNMSVRETAWMAFRPHLAAQLGLGLKALLALAENEDENVRRFAVEVSRPRSVWGAHIAELKREPEMAVELLDRVRSDDSKYVQLAVGNWINDASKTNPGWVQSLCKRWLTEGNRSTEKIVRRGMRTLRQVASQDELGLFGKGATLAG